MGNRKNSLTFALVIFAAGLVFVGCIDNDKNENNCTDIDGDGYGPGCEFGPDCDESNPRLHEICFDIDLYPFPVEKVMQLDDADLDGVLEWEIGYRWDVEDILINYPEFLDKRNELVSMFTPPANNSLSVSFITLDLDGDGDQDYFDLYETTFTVNPDDGREGEKLPMTVDGLDIYHYDSIASYGCAPADIDSDGSDDLICGSISVIEGRLGLHSLINLGGGNFRLNQSFFPDHDAYDNNLTAAVADFDGDGDPDLATLVFRFYQSDMTSFKENPASYSLSIYLNDNGIFTLHDKIYPGHFGNYIWVDDFDQDGAVDLIFDLDDMEKQYGIYWARNLGNGNFQESGRLIETDNREPVAVFDANNDGFKDILLSGPMNHLYANIKPMLYLANPDGGFIKDATFQFVGRQIYHADLNGDGFEDVFNLFTQVGGSKFYNSGVIAFSNGRGGYRGGKSPDEELLNFGPIITQSDDSEVCESFTGVEGASYYDSLPHTTFENGFRSNCFLDKILDIVGDNRPEAVFDCGKEIQIAEIQPEAKYKVVTIIELEQEIYDLAYLDVNSDGKIEILAYQYLYGDDPYNGNNSGVSGKIFLSLIATDIAGVVKVVSSYEKQSDFKSPYSFNFGRISTSKFVKGERFFIYRYQDKINVVVIHTDFSITEETISMLGSLPTFLSQVDIDGDGDQEARYLSTEGIVFVENKGADGFVNHMWANHSTTMGYYYDSIEADIDGDGDLDEITWTGALNAFIQTEPFNFTQVNLVEKFSGDRDNILVDDINGDGSPELIYLQQDDTNGSLNWIKFIDGPDFENHQGPTLVGGDVKFRLDRVGQIDNLPSPDVLVSVDRTLDNPDSGPNLTRYFLVRNPADGIDQVVVLESRGSNYLEKGDFDFDSDGDLDLIMTDFEITKVVSYEPKTEGFTEISFPSLTNYKIRDINCDGLPDIYFKIYGNYSNPIIYLQTE